jgi:tetratricopeptide (TPR) repeat protein
MSASSDQTNDSTTDREDRLAAQLASFDELLKTADTACGSSDSRDSRGARGVRGAGSTPETSPEDALAEMQRAQACLRLLEAVWPRATPSPEAGTLGGSAAHGPATAPRTLGRFVILRQLGRGGFGVVYLAHDPQLGREVALKVPHAGALIDADLRARFQQEARAAAKLDHPNIVAVHEAGEADGSLYIALAYCPGVTLGEWLSGRGAPALPAEAAGLVAALARAVEHAHRQGVVHRDLKPANVLLVSGGVVSGGVVSDGAASAEASPDTDHSLLATHQPKITDFGLAKHLDARAALTKTGTVLGTPAYMAPEQTSTSGRETTPAADVYSLGAILYELVTGRPPFVAEAPLDLLHQVRFVEPLPPRRLVPTLPRDLEVICLKCLEKEPEGRYATAQALADDLDRFLRHEPIEARPIGRMARLGRSCRRHPVVAALLAALAVAVLGGGAGFAWQLRRAEREAAEARQAWDRAEANFVKATQASALADARYEQNWAALDRLTDMSTHLLRRPRLDDAARAGLEELVASYQRFLDEKSDDPAVRQRTARAFVRVAVLCADLGQQAKAEDAFERAGALLEPIGSAANLPLDLRRDLIHYYLNRAFRERQHPGGGRVAAAVKLYEKARAVMEAWLAREPDNPDCQRAIGNLLCNLGVTLIAVREPERAEDCFKQALALQRRLLGAAPQDHGLRQDFALGLESMSQLCQHRDRLAEAEDWCRQAVDVQEKLFGERPKYAPFQYYLGWIHHRLADILVRQHRMADVDKHMSRAIRMLDNLTKSFPAMAQWRAYHGTLLWRSAEHLQAVGKNAAALQRAQRAVETLEQFVADSPEQVASKRELAFASFVVGVLHKADSRHADTLAAFRRTLALHEDLPDSFPREPKYREEVAWRSRDIANQLHDLGYLADAERAYLQALAHFARLAEASPGDAEPRKQQALTVPALLQVARRTKNQDAQLHALRSRARAEPDNGVALNALAWFLATCPDEGRRNLPEARDLAVRAIKLAPGQGFIVNTLGVVHYRLGEYPEAVRVLSQAAELRKVPWADDWFFLAMAHWRLGETEPARRALARAIALMEKNAPDNEELLRFRAEAERLMGVMK